MGDIAWRFAQLKDKKLYSEKFYKLVYLYCHCQVCLNVYLVVEVRLVSVLYSIYTHFNILEKNALGNTYGKR